MKIRNDNSFSYVVLADVVNNAVAEIKGGSYRRRYLYRCIRSTLEPFLALQNGRVVVPRELANLCVQRYMLGLRIKKAIAELNNTAEKQLNAREIKMPAKKVKKAPNGKTPLKTKKTKKTKKPAATNDGFTYCTR